MGIPFGNVARLSLTKDGFRLVVRDSTGKKTYRYPKVRIAKNTVTVGCVTVTKEAAEALITRALKGDVGYLQAERSV